MPPKSPPPIPDMSTLPGGLGWNDFQKYYRGHTNQLVAQQWKTYQQEGGNGDGSAVLPEKARARKSPPTFSRPTDSKPDGQAAASSTKVVLTPSPTARSGRVRKANSLYVGGSYAVDTKASALRVTEVVESTLAPLPELLPYATMLDKIAQRRDARAFAKPMDELWDVKLLEGYYEVIKKPMDLRTVLEKLRRGEYNAGGTDAFAADVRTVWQNCMTYTPDPASPFYQQAQKMSELFESEFEQLVRAAKEREDKEREAKEREAKARAAREREAKERAAKKHEGAVNDAGASKKRPLSDATSSSDTAPKKRSHKKKVKVEGGPSLASATAAAGNDFAALVQPYQPPKSMQQYKEEIVDLLPQLKKRKLRHALDIIRQADESLSSAMDSVPEEEEFSLDLVIDRLEAAPAGYSVVTLLYATALPYMALTALLVGTGHSER